MDESGSYRGINAAGERADSAAIADRSPDRGNRLMDEVLAGPLRPRVANPEDEVLQDLRPLACVVHLGMKLDRVQAALGILDGSHGIVSAPHQPETWRQLQRLVAMRHPDRHLRRYLLKQSRAVQHLHFG